MPGLTVDQMEWWSRFPAFSSLNDGVWPEICRGAKVVKVPGGTVVFRSGDPCTRYMLVLSGSLRVQMVAESGREITLYRVEEGESCVLTTSCLLSGDIYPAEGIAETDVEAVAIPLALFNKGIDLSRGFRQFVFAAYGQRIGNLMMLVEEVAFGRIDARLAQRLLERGDKAGLLTTTHQALASDLGTAREVVSRQLKEFERRGWIRTQRGLIEVIDRPALAALTDAT